MTGRYLPIAGTHGWTGGWWKDDDHPFACMMRQAGFGPLRRRRDGKAWRWSTALDGLLGTNRDWEAFAETLGDFLDPVPYDDRNLIAHSHGGQLAIILAASGFRLRSLTTVGTPVRDDVPAAAAAPHIGAWQHVFDRRRDFIQWAGSVGNGSLDRARSFRVPGVVNHPVDGIRHSHVLNRAEHLHNWRARGWLGTIITGTGTLGVEVSVPATIAARDTAGDPTRA